jgi:hypothetical protein
MIEVEKEDRVGGPHPVSNIEGALGAFNGLYEPGYLDELRSKERA